MLKIDAGDFKHELLNRLRSTMAVNVLRSVLCLSSTNVIFLELSTPGNWPTQLKRWLRIISSKVPFSHISVLEMGLCDKYASLFIPFPYTYAEAQVHKRCNFVCGRTYSTPPKISQLMFRVQSYPAPLVALAWNCSSECNGNNLESLSFLILWRMLAVCVQRLQLNVSLQ